MDLMFTEQHRMVNRLCNMVSGMFYVSQLSTTESLDDSVRHRQKLDKHGHNQLPFWSPTASETDLIKSLLVKSCFYHGSVSAARSAQHSRIFATPAPVIDNERLELNLAPFEEDYGCLDLLFEFDQFSYQPYVPLLPNPKTRRPNKRMMRKS
ncbi:hypothetical protein Aspvir_000563 [Aspergillus viridinutans]|uniref:Uncharacterized protein n=1 Tax=Aspergillus viridinutans TaxID=75553 RepID=A0A9P3BMK7_ASPVI|nr:uncharacterized protein Aspvir_000563 [Aspergillus viridinutans]GIJ98446.1 hypothetical protein Aspvir_000563 [Aspergillus viridinutans]